MAGGACGPQAFLCRLLPEPRLPAPPIAALLNIRQEPAATANLIENHALLHRAAYQSAIRLNLSDGPGPRRAVHDPGRVKTPEPHVRHDGFESVPPQAMCSR